MVLFRLLCKLTTEELLKDLNSCILDPLHDSSELLEQVTPSHTERDDIVNAQQLSLPGMVKQRMVEIACHFHKIIREQDSRENCLKLLESHHAPQFQQYLHKLIDYFVT